MWLSSGFRAPGKPGEVHAGDAARPRPALARHRHNGRAIMRQMLIAAAIAAGLVALWAALLPLAA